MGRLGFLGESEVRKNDAQASAAEVDTARGWMDGARTGVMVAFDIAALYVIYKSLRGIVVVESSGANPQPASDADWFQKMAKFIVGGVTSAAKSGDPIGAMMGAAFEAVSHAAKSAFLSLIVPFTRRHRVATRNPGEWAWVTDIPPLHAVLLAVLLYGGFRLALESGLVKSVIHAGIVAAGEAIPF